MSLNEKIHVMTGGWTAEITQTPSEEELMSYREEVLNAETVKPEKKKRVKVAQYDFLNVFDKLPFQIEIDFNAKLELTRN